VTSAAAKIPRGIDDVDAQWVTAVLRAHETMLDSVTVSGVRAEQIALDSGFSAKLYRLHLVGDGDVPASVVVKLPADDGARMAMDMLGGYTREVNFYANVAGHAPLGTPDVYLACMAPDSTNFVLVLEDLCAWENADYATGITLDRARSCLIQLAGLHAWSADPANADTVASFPSVDVEMMRDLLPGAFGMGWQVYRDTASVPVPPAVDTFAQNFVRHASYALRALTERSTLVHGDFRADNLFFADDQLKVVDFQFAARGAGAADVAYLLGQGLPTALRSGRDEELLAEYLEQLTDRGVSDYSFDDAWRHYRFAVGYQMALPVVALLGAATMPERARHLCMTLIERAVATFDGINAGEVFE
jgi:aminoglycoside/choline kinase family phosphotransferase